MLGLSPCPHSELPDYAAIVPVLLEHGLEQLPKHCGITPGTMGPKARSPSPILSLSPSVFPLFFPGVPLKPMLAQPARCVSELLKRFEEAAFTCEYKYDGERTQVEFWGCHRVPFILCHPPVTCVRH